MEVKGAGRVQCWYGSRIWWDPWGGGSIGGTGPGVKGVVG